MLGTRDEAAKRFADFVAYAKGNSQLVYDALLSLPDNPTDQDVKDYIDRRTGMTNTRDDIELIREFLAEHHDESWKKPEAVAALDRIFAEIEWRTMETAPKDGTNILLWWPEQFHCPLTGHWADKWNPWIGWKVTGWSHGKFITSPTHWRPLPSPPTGETK